MHQGLFGALGGSGNRPEHSRQRARSRLRRMLRKAQKAGLRWTGVCAGRFRNAFPAKTVKPKANSCEALVSPKAEKSQFRRISTLLVKS
jgi:hypothetical protein